ncbi:NAD-dependent epimerase/dehydratase family protein [bacterium]|nr:NAD-dependent epimerase/dehydratase family protein [bacterium]
MEQKREAVQQEKPFDSYLITGATGLVGSSLAEFLVSRGHKVTCFVRPNSDVGFLRSLKVRLVEGDLSIPYSIEKAASGVDVVFHCAAMVSDWADRETMTKINVGGTEKIIKACLQNKTKRMIMLSSLAVLGMDKQDNANESAPYVYTGDNYNYSKIEAEKRVMQACIDHKLPAVIIRPPYIYGVRDRQLLPRVVSALREKKFKFIGDGKNPISMVYVKNLVQALYLASYKKNAVGQIYHITDGNDISRREFIETITQKLGIETPQAHVPVPIAKLMCHILEKFQKISGSKKPPLLNKFRMKFMDTYLTFDISKAQRDLGYTPEYTFRQGLQEALEWFEHGDRIPAGV